MDFSLWPGAHRPWSDVLAAAEYAERTGRHGVWVADHFMPNDAHRAAPDRSMVLGNTYRHPAVVAKAAATLDEMSGGRFVLGIGAGWQVNEHEAYGIELPPVRERLARFEKACQVLTPRWARSAPPSTAGTTS